MSTKRTTITIPEGLYQQALEIMKVRHFDDFSGFLQQLIRDEWERRYARPMDENIRKLEKQLEEGRLPVEERLEVRKTIAAAKKARGRARLRYADGPKVS